MSEPTSDFAETLAGLGGYGARHLLTDLLCGYNSPLSDERVVEFEASGVREYITEWLQRWPQVQEERSLVDGGLEGDADVVGPPKLEVEGARDYGLPPDASQRSI